MVLLFMMIEFSSNEHETEYTSMHRLVIDHYTPCKQSFGGYIGITLSVRLSMYLASATPPKRLIGFL